MCASLRSSNTRTARVALNPSRGRGKGFKSSGEIYMDRVESRQDLRPQDIITPIWVQVDGTRTCLLRAAIMYKPTMSVMDRSPHMMMLHRRRPICPPHGPLPLVSRGILRLWLGIDVTSEICYHLIDVIDTSAMRRIVHWCRNVALNLNAVGSYSDRKFTRFSQERVLGRNHRGFTIKKDFKEMMV
jgi:hypothetical protein